MKGGLGRFLSWLKSRNALIFSTLPRMCPESRLPRGSKIMALLDWFPEIHLHLSTLYGHACFSLSCPCGRTLRSWSDVFPCGTAVRGRWTGVAVRGFTSEGARRAAVGRVAPTGRTCPQAPGGNWPDGNTGGIDNYPVCLRHSGQQSHTYYCLLLSVSWFCRCPCPMATCVMTVSVSTLLTGRCICNCLYLN